VKRRLLLKPLSEAAKSVYDYICNDCQNSFEFVLTLGRPLLKLASLDGDR